MFCAAWLLRSPVYWKRVSLTTLSSEHLRVAELHRVLLVGHVVGLALERKQRDAAVGLLLPVIHVTDAERVLGSQLKIETAG